MGRLHVAIFAEQPFDSLSLEDRCILEELGYSPNVVTYEGKAPSSVKPNLFIDQEHTIKEKGNLNEETWKSSSRGVWKDPWSLGHVPSNDGG